MGRSLNRVEIIGNLTKDPIVKTTTSGTTVCTFTIATNRNWTTEGGTAKEDTEFHKVVAWDKLAQLCGQLLNRGTKVYVEGRLQTKKFSNPDGIEREVVEIVINDMMVVNNPNYNREVAAA